MSDLVRIKSIDADGYYLERNCGLTPNRAEAHLYPRDEAQRIKDMATSPVELEPVEPTPYPKCTEMAAALKEAKAMLLAAAPTIAEHCIIYGNKPLEDAMVRLGAASDADILLAANASYAAKDAEIARLTTALREVEFVLDAPNNPELLPWRRADLAAKIAKAALEGGAA